MTYTWTSPTPNPRQPPLLALSPAPRACVCRQTPRRLPPPCCRPQTAPMSLSSPGGSPAAGTSESLCPASIHVCCSDSRHLLGLGFSGCPCHARTKELGVSTPWQSLVPPPCPPPRYMAMLALSGYPPPLPLLVILIPTPSAKWWGVALERSRRHRESSSHQRG